MFLNIRSTLDLKYLLIKRPDSSTPSYTISFFLSDIKEIVIGISGKWTLYIERFCLGFSKYEVKLPDVYITNFLM